MDVHINLLAVLVAALAQMVLGMLWYGPLFGRTWSAGMKVSPEMMAKAKEKGMTNEYIAAFIGSLLTAYVLAHFVSLLAVTTIGGAAELAFWIWLGFFATASLSQVLWEGKSKTLYAINVGYYLVLLVIVGSILAVWR